MLLHAVGAQGMRERGAGVLLDVGLELVPTGLVVADLLAVHADRQQALKRLDVLDRLLEFLDLAGKGRFQLQDS